MIDCKRRLVVAIAAALALGFVAAASAYPHAAPGARSGSHARSTAKKKRLAPSAAPRRVKSYSFDADTLDGDIPGPGGSTVLATTGAHHGSLIRVRTDFVAEIVRQTDML